MFHEPTEKIPKLARGYQKGLKMLFQITCHCETILICSFNQSDKDLIGKYRKLNS